MNIKSQNGSILLATLSFVILLAAAAASVLGLTMNSYRLTKRNEMRVEARSVAESELENLYYKMFSLILADQPANTLATSALSPTLAAICDLPPGNPGQGDVVPTTIRAPFLPAHQAKNWRVMRSISYDPNYDYFQGIIPETSKYGKVTYLTARIEVMPNLSTYFSNHDAAQWQNETAVKVGRRFYASKSSIFQYGVFYQGDLELAPGGNIIINGAVAANGSIYAGAQGAGSLTFQGKVRYLMGGYFNSDSTGSVVLRKPGTLISGGALAPPLFSVSEGSQVERQRSPENLLGGVDVTSLVTSRPDLFPTENDVYRAAILPPPDATNTNEYPTYDSALGDDPTINAQRMYTRAGIRVTIDTSGTVTFAKSDGTDITANLATGDVGGVTTPVITGAPGTAMYDAREAKNVALTTINMAALKSAIETLYPTGTNDFNGSIYFNVKGSNTTTPRAIRLTNAQTVFSRSGNGMTVTTNGGVYVQGDYNTLASAPDLAHPSGIPNKVDPLAANPVGVVPAMIMGDQVTALSAGWDDANASLDKTHRAATADITIQAGILTGNTSATASVASGGVQSLVRYLELWAGRNVTFFGSLGRLFESKTFVAAWNQPGLGDVYGTPASRTFTFDSLLRDSPPSGSPTTTNFDRGTFFVWN